MTQLKSTVRGLGRHRGTVGFALAVVGPCLGIASLIFSVVDGLIFRPLPFRNSASLVLLQEFEPATGKAFASISEAEFDEIMKTPAFSAGATYWLANDRAVFHLDHDVTVEIARIDDAFIGALGTEVVAGRFVPGPRDIPAAVLSYSVWTREFGQSGSVVGQVVNTDAGPVEVVAVLPKEFVLPTSGAASQADVLMRLERGRGSPDRNRVMALARLSDGWSISRAQQAMDITVQSTRRQYPSLLSRTSVRAKDMLDAMFELYRPRLLILIYAAIGCALAAAITLGVVLIDIQTRRESDLVIKAALGASRSRLVLEGTKEGALIAILGAGLGAATAWLVAPVVASSIPDRAFQLMFSGFDGRTLVFVILISILVIAVASVGPLVFLGRASLAANRYLSNPSSTSRLHAGLLAMQLALGVVAVTTACFVWAGVRQLTPLSLGVNGSDLYFVPFASGRSPVRTVTSRLEEIRAVPGVRSAGAASAIPLSVWNVGPVGLSATPLASKAITARATSGYFSTSGTPLLAGREFHLEDDRAETHVAIVSVNLSSLGTGKLKIGDQITLGIMEQPREVIGIVADVRQGFEVPPRPMIYLPIAGGDAKDLAAVVRSSVPASTLQRRLVAAGLDPKRPVLAYGDRLDRVIVFPRFQLRMALGLTFVFTLISISGAYLLASRFLTAKWLELGIRTALGASRLQLTTHLCRNYIAPLALGVGGGLTVAWILHARLMVVVNDLGKGSIVPWILGPLTIVVLVFLVGLLASRKLALLKPSDVLRA